MIDNDFLHKLFDGGKDYQLTRFRHSAAARFRLCDRISCRRATTCASHRRARPDAGEPFSRVASKPISDPAAPRVMRVPTLFWFGISDNGLSIFAWIGFGLSLVVLAGYANAIILAILWAMYMSIVHIGQIWYGYGWETQLLETGFLRSFFARCSMRGHFRNDRRRFSSSGFFAGSVFAS